MKQSIILGIGTGRCGTASLAKILNQQPDTVCSFDEPPLLPWKIGSRPSQQVSRPMGEGDDTRVGNTPSPQPLSKRARGALRMALSRKWAREHFCFFSLQPTTPLRPRTGEGSRNGKAVFKVSFFSQNRPPANAPSSGILSPKGWKLTIRGAGG